jgi:hypothetical protein
VADPPPPLPYISGDLVYSRVVRSSGDRALGERLLEAMARNLRGRYDGAREAAPSYDGVAGPPYGRDTGPGSPAQPLSMAEVEALFADLAGLEYIPFDFPVEGCNARAHEMCRVMRERGIVCAKAWTIEVDRPPYAYNKEFGDTQGYVYWHHHVAPTVCVAGPDGKTIEMVLDPALAKGPLTMEQWLEKQGGPFGLRLERTDDGPYIYTLVDPKDPDSHEALVELDPGGASTRAALDLFRLNRDVLRIQATLGGGAP